MFGGLLCVLVGVSCRSWMWMWGAVGVLAVMFVGMVSTLGDGASGGQLNRRVDGGLVGWFATWRVRGRAGRILGLLLNGWLGDHSIVIVIVVGCLDLEWVVVACVALVD